MLNLSTLFSGYQTQSQSQRYATSVGIRGGQPQYGNASNVSNTNNVGTTTGTTGTSTNGAGNSQSNPFILSDATRWVDWNSGNSPQYISYNGNIYKASGSSKQGNQTQLLYKATKNLPNGQNNLYITFTGNARTDVIGSKTEQVQVGTQRVQIGTQRVQTGTQRVQTGTEHVQTGTQRVQTGTQQVQVGTDRVQTGTEHVQTGTQRVQTGTQHVQTGTTRVQTGTEHVQTGTQRVQTGTKRVQTGTIQVQTGTQRIQTGTQRVQTGTEHVQTGTRVVGTETTSEQVSLKISRELDGKQDTGAIGDMLTRGTTQLSDANQFFSGAQFNKYRVSSLTGTDNQAVSSDTNPITDRLGADDMFVAGDPSVGGKGNNYASVNVTPATGYMTMFEDGTDTGRKVTVNAHADVINTQGNKAFTEYGFVIQDDNGQKTTAALSGGKLNITAPDGTVKTLQPGETYTIGSASDPVAKFYYASMPGGENGTNEQRLVFQSFEKPSQDVINKLTAAGMSATDAAALRNSTTASFGFRVPDGKGSYRMPAGVTGNAMTTTSNGVKTYYDAHFNEAPEQEVNFTKYTYTPKTEPVYEDRPVYTDQPVYCDQPIYTDQPVYEDRPVYTETPRYEDRPVYCDQPVYEDRPVYTDQPVYCDQPIYKDQPVYETQCVPVYGQVNEICKNLASPLVLDLDGDGIATTAPKATVDVDGDGNIDTTSWFGGNEGVLAFDANKNGQIDLNGKELFGDSSDIDGDGQSEGYANGFEALKALANQTLGTAATADGVLDTSELKALEAKAGLKMIVNNQAHSLSDFGINSINLGYTSSDAVDPYGNQLRQQGSFNRTLSNGQTVDRNITDVWLLKADPSVAASTPAIASPSLGTASAGSTVKSAISQPTVSSGGWANLLSQLRQWLQMLQR